MRLLPDHKRRLSWGREKDNNTRHRKTKKDKTMKTPTTQQTKAIAAATLKEFRDDMEEQIIDCQTNADTGRGVSRTELDNVPAVFEELSNLQDTTPYDLGNKWNWKLSGADAITEITYRRVWAECPEADYEEVREAVDAALKK